jgi:hypothetical protein
MGIMKRHSIYSNYKETFKGQMGIMTVCFDIKCPVVAQRWARDGHVLLLWRMPNGGSAVI